MQGQLFSQDFLRYGIRQTLPYQSLTGTAFAGFEARLRDLFRGGADDAAYVLGTFPIVQQHEEAAFGHYRLRDEVLALLRLLPAPKVDRDNPEPGPTAT